MLRVSAFCVAYGSAVFWVLGGANRGWTKTSVTRWELDAVTGINGPVIHPLIGQNGSYCGVTGRLTKIIRFFVHDNRASRDAIGPMI